MSEISELLKGITYGVGIGVGIMVIGINLSTIGISEYRIQNYLKQGNRDLAAQYYKKIVKNLTDDVGGTILFLPTLIELGLHYRGLRN